MVLEALPYFLLLSKLQNAHLTKAVAFADIKLLKTTFELHSDPKKPIINKK